MPTIVKRKKLKEPLEKKPLRPDGPSLTAMTDAENDRAARERAVEKWIAEEWELANEDMPADDIQAVEMITITRIRRPWPDGVLAAAEAAIANWRANGVSSHEEEEESDEEAAPESKVRVEMERDVSQETDPAAEQQPDQVQTAPPPDPPAKKGRRSKAAEGGPKADAKETAVRDFGGQALSRISIDRCVRHPANRHPKPAAIAKIAGSIDREGLLEPIVVRPLPFGHPHKPQRTGPEIDWQIISGETRVLALRQMGRDKGEIDAHVLTNCSDARALELVAIYNADREDLDPIDRAKLIVELCKPIDEGGSGLTREAAAKRVGLESHSAASNLVRLLELPEVWQERVASGEVPMTFARELVPYAHVPPLMAKCDRSWRKEPERWETRELVGRMLAWIVRENTRPIDKGEQVYFDGHAAFQNWNYNGHYPRLFDLTPEVERELEIVELPGERGKTRRVALNTKRWDALQKPAVKKHVDSKRSGEKPAKSKGDKRELTPAQQKAKAKEQAEQFARRLQAWRIDWLRMLVARDLLSLQNPNLTTPALWRLLLWLATGPTQYSGVREALAKPLELKCNGATNYWAALCFLADGELLGEETPDIPIHFAAALLFDEAQGPCQLLPDEVVEGLARMLEVDVAEAWRQERAGPLTDDYWALHTKDQLAALAGEFGILVVGSKADMVNKLAADERTLKKLPAELAGEKKSTAKKGKVKR